MKLHTILSVTLIALSSSVLADSPSSAAAQSGVNPSTVTTAGGFDFDDRDNGQHEGWCKGQGHLVDPGMDAGGHRNHWDCLN